MSYSLTVSALPSLSRLFLNAFKHRGRVGIVVDILDTIKTTPKGKTKCQIMQGAKLNYEQTKRFLNVLILCDLIRAEPLYYGKRRLTRYMLTEHGSECLAQLQRLQFTMTLLSNKAI